MGALRVCRATYGVRVLTCCNRHRAWPGVSPSAEDDLWGDRHRRHVR